MMKIEEDTKQHYVLIKDFDKLLLRINKHNNKKYFCRFCLQSFTSQEILNEHIKNCMIINGCQATDMPKEGNNITKFTNIKNMLSCPFVIYADLEAILKPMKNDIESLDKDKSSTVKTAEHEACSFGYKVICRDNDKLSKPFRMFRGVNAIPEFFEGILKEEKEINEHMKRFKNSRVIMTNKNWEEYNKADRCYLCNEKFDNSNKELRKVKDHNHVNDLYRGAAHDKCNLQLRLSYKIPVIFHNLKNYDSHHLMQNIGQFTKKINVIPLNMEKYLSFSIGTERIEWD